jgi:hypothetical protein
MFILVNDDGSICSVSEYEIKHSVDGATYVEDDTFSTFEDYFGSYYFNGVFYRKGEKPTEYHVFDYTTKSWVESSELKTVFLKKEKNRVRAELIETGLNYGNLNYQIDSDSRLNVIGKALELQLNPAITTVNWISNTQDDNGNDVVNTFTREEFIDFAKQVASYYESIVLEDR